MQVRAEYFCSPRMRRIKCTQSLDFQIFAKTIRRRCHYCSPMRHNMCAHQNYVLLVKGKVVHVCYGSSATFYISLCSCLYGSCCYVHCYLQSHHPSVNTLSHLWVLLEFNLCSSEPRAVCQALITKTMHSFCWVWGQFNDVVLGKDESVCSPCERFFICIYSARWWSLVALKLLCSEHSWCVLTLLSPKCRQDESRGMLRTLERVTHIDGKR